MLLFRPSKQQRQGIPFPPPSKGLAPSPMMQQVLQELHVLLAGTIFSPMQTVCNQRAQDTGFSVTDPAFNTSPELRRRLLCSAHSVQQGQCQPRQLRSTESLEMDGVVVFADRSLGANQQNGCPALHNACTANIINLIYHWGTHTAPVHREHHG